MFVLIRLVLVKVAHWPPIGKELLIRLTVFSLCIMHICNFSYFLFWFRGQQFGTDCNSSWSMPMFYFKIIL